MESILFWSTLLFVAGMSFSEFLGLELLDHVFGAAAYTAPGTVYIALSTTTPTAAGGNFTEPSGNGYARVAVTNNKTNWSTDAAGALENAVAFAFAQATGSWGTVRQLAGMGRSNNFKTDRQRRHRAVCRRRLAAALGHVQRHGWD